MKCQIAAACLALVTLVPLCRADTLSYTVPVLTVTTDDADDVVPDSGRLHHCPFSFVETTNGTPVKVAVMEDTPSGAGNTLRASLWLAVTTASLSMNRSLSGTIVNFETSGYVDGPSAGSMLCLAVMSAIDRRTFPEDFVMAGTIMVDGTVGAVGGVAEKLRAANRAGIRRVCIPASVRMDEDHVDLLELGKALDLEIHQVATIDDAYRIMHRLPADRSARLSPIDACQLPQHVESVLKEQFIKFCGDLPPDSAQWNDRTKRSIGEYRAGMFGAAAIDMVDGLDEYFMLVHCQDGVDFERYRILKDEFSANRAEDDEDATHEQYVAALQSLHRDLKAADAAGEESDLEPADEEEEEQDEYDIDPDWDSDEDWFEDQVSSPSDAQFITLASLHFAKATEYSDLADGITREIDSVRDWNGLDAEALNLIRKKLLLKSCMRTMCKSLDVDAENYERHNAIFARLCGSIPYIRPNADFRQVENIFYRTMKSMELALKGDLADHDRFAKTYGALLGFAEQMHLNVTEDVDVLNSVFAEAQALSMSCALMMRDNCGYRHGVGNSAFFSAAVSTARENALVNISECRKLGIPCVMPVIYFQLAESRRGYYSADGEAENERLGVFSDYLQASLSARALVLCFAGQRPELNEKGYCSKWVTVDEDESCITVRYLGVDGEPVLRDGFSGYRFFFEDGERTITTWLDPEDRDARVRTSNECYTVEYDDAGRKCRQTYCTDSWNQSPREDGVLFETYGYDDDGNLTSWEYFGGESNRVTDVDGVAVVRNRYNRRGMVTRRRFYGVDLEPTCHRDGNAGFDVVYDRNGNQRRFTYVNARGEPVMTSHGYAIEERKYNSGNHETERAWYDEKSGLVNVDGVAKIRKEYDDNGSITSQAYYGADDSLTLGGERYAIARCDYDANGERIAVSYFGTDGKPTMHSDGISSWKAVVDDVGRIVSRRYFDTEGNEIEFPSRK